MRELWRIAATPIVLVCLLAFLLFGAWWGYQNVVSPAPGSLPVPCVTQSVGTTLNSTSVTVNVYNGGRTTGLAGEVGNTLEKRGFMVSTVANTDEAVTATVIKGASVDDPAVKLVAMQFRSPQIVADGRVDGTVDVLVGTTFKGFVGKVGLSITVPNGLVCLPSPTPTPVVSSPAAAPAS